MIKEELIEIVSKKTGFTQQEIAVILHEIIDTIKNSLLNGEDVVLRTFGRFKLEYRRVKKCWLVRTNMKEIKDGYIPRFRFSRKLMRIIRKANEVEKYKVVEAK